MSASIGILTGPTATGKTALAIELARQTPGLEIVNADSLLVFRHMDIGTAKPTLEERHAIPHHLVDIRDPDQNFTAGDFVREANTALEDIRSRGGRALVVGGSGFYLKALLYGLWDAPPADVALRAELEGRTSPELYAELEKRDPESAYRIGVNDRYRLVRALELLHLTGKSPSELQAAKHDPDPRFRLWVIDRTQEELIKRVAQRTRAMVRSGLIEEVRMVAERFPGARPLGSVGYAQVLEHLAGRSPAGRKVPPGIEGLESEVELATRQLIKRQRTWFRGQKIARWFVLDQDRAALEAEWRELYG
jgi:tRNA dimethylallyltransferase